MTNEYITLCYECLLKCVCACLQPNTNVLILNYKLHGMPTQYFPYIDSYKECHVMILVPNIFTVKITRHF